MKLKYKGLDYTIGDKITCIKETSGQGGTVRLGETGIAGSIYQDPVCSDCVDFRRDSDGTYVHAEASAFVKVCIEKCNGLSGENCHNVADSHYGLCSKCADYLL